MTQALWQRLYDAAAFKPRPPDYELATAHVRVGEVGIPKPIDERVLHAMTTDDEAFVIVIGPPGSGKSSILTAAARDAARPDSPPHPLPLKVPVAHHDVKLTAELLVRAIAQGLAHELRGHLSKAQTKKLELALATTISKTRQPGGSSGSLTAGLPGVLSASVGGALGKDLLTLTTNASWQGGGPVNTLLSLRDLAAAHHARLVVIFHDTDIWSVADDDMAVRARSFFSALRVLLDCPEITFIVAVQTYWAETAGESQNTTNTARREYQALAELAGVRLDVPLPRSNPQALALITAIINRRVAMVLDTEDQPDGGWASVLFTPSALELLAHRCKSKSVRRAISDIRDALDRAEVMPEKLDREHLLDVIVE
jgi:hypothetical protein